MKRKLGHVGALVRDARKAAKLTQAQIAEHSGLGIPAIRAIERSSGRLSSLTVILKTLNLELRGRQLVSGAIGPALALARKNRKISRRELSKSLRVSRNTLASVEEGGGLVGVLEAYAVAVGAGLYLSKPDAKKTFFSHAAIGSNYQGWQTPENLGEALSNAVGGFDLDPAAATTDRRKARVKAKILLTEADEGLQVPWGPGKKVYCNPLYNRGLGAWIKKCHDEAGRGSMVVALVPSRSDTRWWHDWVVGRGEVFILKGRLKFGEGINSAPFGSAVIVWNAGPDIVASLAAALQGAWHVPLSAASHGMKSIPDAVSA